MDNPLPCACTTVRKANRSLFRFYDRQLENAGLTVTQFAMLRAIERKGSIELSRLAEELIMERTSLYRSIAHLEKSGDVEIQSLKNKRTKVVRLTRVGERAIARALPFWQKAQDKVVSSIGEENWKMLSGILLEIPELVHNIK